MTGSELGILFGLGAIAAAATVLLDLRLRLPGHAILRATLPMALGLAMVPRRYAGISMSCGALVTLLLLAAAGNRLPGGGATTSLLLTGPLLDCALQRAREGWQIYAGFAIAGLASNGCAFLLRAPPQTAGLGRAGHSFAQRLAAHGLRFLHPIWPRRGSPGWMDWLSPCPA